MEPFIDESINSPLLEDYLRGSEAAKYDAVLFLPYLYGIVVRGIEAFPGRAHLLPCLHDEAYARLPRIEDAVHRAATLLFNSEGEAELALRIYGPGILHKSHVIGTGVALPTNGVAASGFAGSYFLYLGRRDETKGVDFLVEAFSQYRRGGASAFSLVLAGPGAKSYHDPAHGIVDLGFVDEGTKRTLIRQARALAQPSLNESYSRVIMEAWRERVPVIARGECLATSIAVHRSGGGLVADGLAEWAAAFSRLETAGSEEFEEFGQRGLAYAAVHAEWSRVIERFRDATGIGSDARPPKRGKRVDQVIESMAYGDAISDYAHTLQAHLQTQGHDGTIYARVIHPRVLEEARPLWAAAFSASDALVYHHSIAFNEIEMIRSAPGQKALIYHNITPARYFRDYDFAFAEHLERGRAQLAELAGTFKVCAADSEFNARELRDLGFQNVNVVPVPVNFSRFDVTPAQIPIGGDGAQWLFVGRVSPNKGLRPLLEAFEAYVCLDPFARLILVGAYNPGDRYFQELAKFVFERSLEANVVFAGVVDEATLTAHYRNADLYVCLSYHEGFCVPLVEAMFFDIPIIASANTAIVETLGDSGILIDPDADPVEIAVMAREISTDDALRKRIIESQRNRRRSFLPERIMPIVDAFIAEIA
jgi:glycosyltransferase involved in cell wall biosynthesis